MKGLFFILIFQIGLLAYAQDHYTVLSVKGKVLVEKDGKRVVKGMKLTEKENFIFSSIEDAIAVIHPTKGRLIIKPKSGTELTKSEFVTVVEDLYTTKKEHAKTALIKPNDMEAARREAVAEQSRQEVAKVNYDAARAAAEKAAAERAAALAQSRPNEKGPHLLELPEGIYLLRFCSTFEEADAISDGLYFEGYKYVRVGYVSSKDSYCIVIDRFSDQLMANQALEKFSTETREGKWEVMEVE